MLSRPNLPRRKQNQCVALSPWQIAPFLMTLLLLPAAFAATSGGSGKPLEKLDGDLLHRLELPKIVGQSVPLQPRSADDPPTSEELLPELDELRRLLDPTLPPLDGEDLGAQRESPLGSIANRMNRARQLIGSRDDASKTKSEQSTILTELDALIDKLNKQCQSCSGSQGDKPTPPKVSQSTTPKPGAKPAGSKSPSKAATESRVSAGGATTSQPGEAPDAEIAKQLWGQLPDRLRQQLLQSSADEFLPKYKKDIEAYFERLSEEQGSEPAAR